MQYVQVRNDTAVLSVNGIFNFGKCKIVSSEINVALQNGCTKIAVDFDKTKFIDSAAIRMLCDFRENVHPANFAVGNAHGKVLTVLQGANLEEWLKF
jgi:anti-anti-sigma factor